MESLCRNEKNWLNRISFSCSFEVKSNRKRKNLKNEKSKEREKEGNMEEGNC
jgi:hypothetical protein